MIKYREDAARHISWNVGLELTEHLHRVLQRQIRLENAQYLFRHSCVVIVYLLRIRRHDDSYLDPESELAVSVKTTFRHAKQAAKTGKLQLVGGMVNLPAMLDALIEYIDRRGRGVPEIAEQD